MHDAAVRGKVGFVVAAGVMAVGMRISRSEPMATSNRVTNAAPLRHKFSLEVSSSKLRRDDRVRGLCSGRRTAILRSDLCLDGELSWTMRGGLVFLDRWAVSCIRDRHMIIAAGKLEPAPLTI